MARWPRFACLNLRHRGRAHRSFARIGVSVDGQEATWSYPAHAFHVRIIPFRLVSPFSGHGSRSCEFTAVESMGPHVWFDRICLTHHRGDRSVHRHPFPLGFKSCCTPTAGLTWHITSWRAIAKR